ncbi:hypothetical protein [Mesorhizobium australicum]|uniref:Lipoprotein n=1 Tax=Mesorhizobium australicum TaxID=536018 RepID=A0A1X7PIX9_9HYPH|nr:hypothetical protein SAMN02982922_4279 [Mesorhizobium australicum]
MPFARYATAPRAAVRPLASSAVKRAVPAAACLLALAIAGCTTSPARYAASLPQQDPKFHSPQCFEMRARAANYEAGRKPPMSWATGALMGPYGLAIAAASKEHQEKQRRLFARDMHLACSSRPLPRELDVEQERPAEPGSVPR